MTIGGGFDHFNKALQSDIEQWDTISQLNVGQDFAILEDVGTHEATVLPLETRVGQTFQAAIKITPHTAANIEWLAKKGVETRQHVRGFVQSINESDPIVLKESLNVLGKLKQTMSAAVNNGYNHLKITYAGQQTSKMSVQEILLNEQRELTNQLMGEIDTAIIALGNKLETRKSDLHEAQELRSKSFIARAFDSASKLINKQEPEPSIGVVAKLVDPTANEQWAVAMSGPWLEQIDPEKRAEYGDAGLIPGHFVARELQGSSAKLTTSEGTVVSVPLQFKEDLHRTPYFTINGQLSYSNRHSFNYNEGDTYVKLYTECAKKVGVEKATDLAFRIASLMNQGIAADLAFKARAIHSPSVNAPYHPGAPGGIIWSIAITPEKVTIVAKTCVTLRQMDESSEALVNVGSVLVKRVIEIPVQTLLIDSETLLDKVQKNNEKLPGIQVTDTFSRMVESSAYAETLLDVF